jgi:hypothetical protein
MSEPEPGVMHPVDEAFYKLAIKERDYERAKVDRLEAELFEARRMLGLYALHANVITQERVLKAFREQKS